MKDALIITLLEGIVKRFPENSPEFGAYVR